MNRILLIRHGTTAETRRACFPATNGARAADRCEPLDGAGREQAAVLRDALPTADRCWSSFAVRAVETARLAGCEPEPSADLADCDFGRWAGLLPSEADGVAGWYADLESTPHGGERLSDVRARAAKVLVRARETGGTVIAFTHSGLIRSALCEALGLESHAMWMLEAAPGSVAELHPADVGDRWRIVRVNWTPGRLP